MPRYAYAATFPDSLGLGRTAQNVSYKADTRADWVAIVDELPDGAVEITREEYLQRVAEAEVYNDALPQEPEPAPTPSPLSLFFSALADEWGAAAVELRGGRAGGAADALDRAATLARGAANG